MTREKRAWALCALFLAFSVGDARAEEPILVWTPAEGCVSEGELSTLVHQQLPPPEGERLRSVVGTVRLVEGASASESFEVVLEVHEGGQALGKRVLTLSGPDCRSHDDTIALVVALLLEHGAPTPESEEPAEKPSEDPPKPEKEPAEEPPLPTESANSSLPFRAFGGVALAFGWLPRAAPGPRLGLGVSPLSGVWFDVLGTYFPSQQDSGQAGAYDFRSLGGRVHGRGCAGPELGPFRLEGCLGLGAGFAKLSGQGTDRTYDVLFAAPEARGDVQLLTRVRGPVLVSLGGSLLVPFSQARFVFLEQGEETQVHETNPLVGEISADILIKF